MDHRALQVRLAERGCDPGPIDGIYGRRTRAATLLGLTAGADNPVSIAEVETAAITLGCTPAHVMAVMEVEASGKPFINGLPTILFEPHRFSAATGRLFDTDFPTISYRRWGARPYPATQAARYDQLLTAIGLNVDAGFASASYGAFQILGENWQTCGYLSPFAFAMAQAQSEGDQLEAFVRFLLATGLDRPLRAGDWAAFARGYNGTGYRSNRYDERLEAAFVRQARLAA